jgi:adenosylcobinamide-GDP ribazoletransferase
MLQITALDFCVISERGTQAVVLSVVCGRLAMSVACRRSVPAARPAGLGAQVAGTVPGHRAALLVVLVALQALAWGSLDNHAGVAGAVRAAIAVAVSLAVAEVVVRRARRRLGGITGDVLGAACELSMTSTLIVMAVTVGPQLRR